METLETNFGVAFEVSHGASCAFLIVAQDEQKASMLERVANWVAAAPYTHDVYGEFLRHDDACQQM